MQWWRQHRVQLWWCRALSAGRMLFRALVGITALTRSCGGVGLCSVDRALCLGELISPPLKARAGPPAVFQISPGPLTQAALAAQAALPAQAALAAGGFSNFESGKCVFLHPLGGTERIEVAVLRHTVQVPDAKPIRLSTPSPPVCAPITDPQHKHTALFPLSCHV